MPPVNNNTLLPGGNIIHLQDGWTLQVLCSKISVVEHTNKHEYQLCLNTSYFQLRFIICIQHNLTANYGCKATIFKDVISSHYKLLSNMCHRVFNNLSQLMHN